MTALICVRCGDDSLTVEAAAEYVAAHGQLPACACERQAKNEYMRAYRAEERPKNYDVARGRAYRRAYALLRERHPEEFARLYEEAKQFVGLAQHRAGAS